MYEYAEKNEVRKYRTWCSEVMEEIRDVLKERYAIVSQPVMIGSGAKNLVTRNGGGPFDLDYNLEILYADGKYWEDLGRLKGTVKRTAEESLRRRGVQPSSVKDSTSCITVILFFRDEPQVQFSFDIGIIAEDEDGYSRLIHRKEMGLNRYLWNQAPNSAHVKMRADWLKKNGYWEKVRERYLEKKNLYLLRGEEDCHPSFNVYIETVNEIYQAKRKAQRVNG